MRSLTLPILAATILFAPADSTRAQTVDAPVMGPVMEIVDFRLMPGVSDATFLAYAAATQDMVASQPGFLRRSLLRDEGGLWTDMVMWQSLQQAMAAAEVVMADPAFGPFGAAIDMSTLQMRHTPVLWQMGD